MERVITPKAREEDKKFDSTLRPRNFTEFIGQENLKSNLQILIEAAKMRREPIDHLLLCGGPGLGKTSLAHIIARQSGVNIRVTSGPALEKAGDLASILTNLEEGDILFIDEIHRLNKLIEEVLYPAMEDYRIDIILGRGPGARTLSIDLPRFTLVGATTRPSMLSSPLRDRFGAVYNLTFYKTEDLEKIVRRSSGILDIEIEDEGAEEIGKRSRGTPRVANRLLKRVRDFVQVSGKDKVTKNLAQEAMERLEIDPLGLDELDRRILQVIIEKFKGGPVGLNTIAAACAEEMDTIEELYEPFLMQIGFLSRTPRGRLATDAAYKHLNLETSGLLLSS